MPTNMRQPWESIQGKSLSEDKKWDIVAVMQQCKLENEISPTISTEEPRKRTATYLYLTKMSFLKGTIIIKNMEPFQLVVKEIIPTTQQLYRLMLSYRSVIIVDNGFLKIVTQLQMMSSVL